MILDGRVALVTGAQQGIGAAAAVALARRGAKVVVNYLDDEAAAQAVCAEAAAAGPEAVAVAGDVSIPRDVARMVEAADGLGGIDILVNNAGIFPRVAFLDMTEADWDAVHGVNLRGTFLCTQAAARSMVAGGRAGSVVNLASSAVHSGPPLGVHYAASKAGIVGLTRAAAIALAPHRIRVNAVAPGLTDTAQPRDGMTEQEIAEYSARLPLGRMATPADIADVVAFLAGPESRNVTGEVVQANGGQLLL